MITIAFANQKGGVGKSTSTETLGAILAAQGRRVLLIDIDPQASLSQGLGVDGEGASMAQVLGGAERGTLGLADIGIAVKDNLVLAPSDLALAACELGLVQRIGRENVLKHALSKIEGIDTVLIDCAPSLGILTVNALAAADGVIVPSLPAPASLRGVRMFLTTLEDVQAQDGINPDLELLGVILTQFDGRTNLHKEAQAKLEADGLKLLGVIPRGVRVQDAGAAAETLIEHDPKGKATAAYYQAAERLKAWLKKKESTTR
ncbi:MAG: ParA family protein [Gammaproteobacteria bacterium]|nr:ParA family protein [Gammaproteobacteria bacterium]